MGVLPAPVGRRGCGGVDWARGDHAGCDFAGDSRHANPWAAQLYARARGPDHQHAVRILDRAWANIIWRCWQDNAPDDPTRHATLPQLLNQELLNQDQRTAA